MLVKIISPLLKYIKPKNNSKALVQCINRYFSDSKKYSETDDSTAPSVVKVPKGRMGRVVGTDDENLDGHWRSMESRTINRPAPRMKGSIKGRVGIRKSEEDHWAVAGVYENKKNE